MYRSPERMCCDTALSTCLYWLLAPGSRKCDEQEACRSPGVGPRLHLLFFWVFFFFSVLRLPIMVKRQSVFIEQRKEFEYFKRC